MTMEGGIQSPGPHSWSGLCRPRRPGSHGLDHVRGFFGDHDDRALVLPEVIVGMIDASTTRNPATPCTRNSSVTTAPGS